MAIVVAGGRALGGLRGGGSLRERLRDPQRDAREGRGGGHRDPVPAGDAGGLLLDLPLVADHGDLARARARQDGGDSPGRRERAEHRAQRVLHLRDGASA